MKHYRQKGFMVKNVWKALNIRCSLWRLKMYIKLIKTKII